MKGIHLFSRLVFSPVVSNWMLEIVGRDGPSSYDFLRGSVDIIVQVGFIYHLGRRYYIYTTITSRRTEENNYW